ncbi:MAG: membrane protein insertase YidC [Deltaproteobacteria bacterium]|nr:membrane protein insertase YidC [Deltaproteobacteria bacterium]
MEIRMLVALSLSVLVMVGYYVLFPPPEPQVPPPQAQQQAQQQAQPGTQTDSRETRPEAEGTEESAASVQKDAPPRPATETAGQNGGSVTKEQEAVQADAPAPARGDVPVLEAPTSGRLIPVETPLYAAEIDTIGGKLVSFRLKHYMAAKRNISWGDVVPALREYFDKVEVDDTAQVEMVRKARRNDDMFGVRFVGEDSLSRQFSRVNFATDSDAVRLVGGQADPARLVLSGTGPDGLTVEKSFTFFRDTYVVGYTLAVVNHGQETRNIRVASMFGEGPAVSMVAYQAQPGGPIWREDGSVNTETADDIEGQVQVPLPEWLGISDTYFLSAVQPRSRISHGFYESSQEKSGEEKIWVATYGVELPQVALQPGKMIESDFQMYLGPKQADEMARFGSRLEESLNLTLDFLARPMLALMNWFQSIVGNWGIAIILLTVVVRVLLFPFTYKGMISMKRMQKIQPKFKAIREKFKNDKERLNKEVMLLYRKHRVNPLGGCLPIALQIPVFFALYSALMGAIELRHTSFFGWMTDLSAKDGLYVMPLLMGASMYYQMKLSPSSPDPTQARIMQWMPVLFTFFMFQFPSGLVLYWLTSNLLSILQQYLINRVHIPEPVEN